MFSIELMDIQKMYSGLRRRLPHPDVVNKSKKSKDPFYLYHCSPKGSPYFIDWVSADIGFFNEDDEFVSVTDDVFSRKPFDLRAKYWIWTTEDMDEWDEEEGCIRC